MENVKDLSEIIYDYPLTEEFIDKYYDKNGWEVISEVQKLSEEFIERHSDKVFWSSIPIYQKLSEEFLERNIEKMHGNYVFAYQKLSERFIEKYNMNQCWDIISQYQYLSDEFIEKYKDKLDIVLIEDNWIYKTTEEKKQAVIDTCLYECYDDYFIAYKAIRPDRYSLYNFQYKYEKGGIYESWCDCSHNKDSFGLNVGTEEFANEYGDLNSDLGYTVVRCKVRYEDVGRVVHGGSKIRCFKIEILD